MKPIFLILMAFALTVQPVAHAKISPRMTAVIALELAKYQGSLKLLEKKGVASFVANYSASLSKPDQAYLTSTLVKFKKYPSVTNDLSNGFALTLSGTRVDFDLRFFDDGVVRVSGVEVKANFGGSLEEVASEIETALKKSHSKKFNDTVVHSLMNVLVPSAHAADAAVWGALIAIIGAIIFKGVYDSKNAKKKKEQASKPAYVDEGRASQASTHSGGGVVEDYSQINGPAQAAAVTTTNPRPEYREPEVKPNPNPQLLPPPTVEPAPEPGLGGDNVHSPSKPVQLDMSEIESYKDAMCTENTEFSITSNAHSIFKKYSQGVTRPYEFLNKNQFARLEFVKAVLGNFKKINDSTDAELKKLEQPYLNFLNKVLKMDPKAEVGSQYTDAQIQTMVEKGVFAGFEMMADIGNSGVDYKKPHSLDLLVSGGSPKLFFNFLSKKVQASADGVPSTSKIDICEIKENIGFAVPSPVTSETKKE